MSATTPPGTASCTRRTRTPGPLRAGGGHKPQDHFVLSFGREPQDLTMQGFAYESQDLFVDGGSPDTDAVTGRGLQTPTGSSG
eukprot:2052423-Alexandrium_andersonii.AAC.1